MFTVRVRLHTYMYSYTAPKATTYTHTAAIYYVYISCTHTILGLYRYCCAGLCGWCHCDIVRRRTVLLQRGAYTIYGLGGCETKTISCDNIGSRG